jgi:hypothetical protein
MAAVMQRQVQMQNQSAEEPAAEEEPRPVAPPTPQTSTLLTQRRVSQNYMGKGKRPPTEE